MDTTVFEIRISTKDGIRKAMKVFGSSADLLKFWYEYLATLDVNMQRIGTGKDGYLTDSYDSEYHLVKRINGKGYPLTYNDIPSFFRDWLKREAVTIDVFHTFYFMKLTEEENILRLSKRD
jgi:hypothetical protein